MFLVGDKIGQQASPKLGVPNAVSDHIDQHYTNLLIPSSSNSDIHQKIFTSQWPLRCDPSDHRTTSSRFSTSVTMDVFAAQMTPIIEVLLTNSNRMLASVPEMKT